MPSLKVAILYFDDCPGYEKAGQAMREVLAAEGIRGGFESIAVNSNEEAEWRRFPGNPTIRVDGEDLFPEDLELRMSRRLFVLVHVLG